MPNSSARCAQLPRAVDKVPFYKALTKYRDYLKGDIPDIDEAEVVFSDIKLKTFNEKVPEFAKMNSEFKISDSSDPNAGKNILYILNLFLENYVKPISVFWFWEG